MTERLVDVVRLSTRYLADRGSDSARLDAELLVAHAMQLRRLDVYLQHDRPLTDAELAPIRELLRRRGRGEPVAHLLGEREFLSRAFRVGPGALIPRPETELLVERALEACRMLARAPGGDGLVLADVGTGTGCIAVSLALALPDAVVHAVDLSGDALALAALNVARHGVSDRVHLHRGSWLEPLAGMRLDAVVANPPYIATAELDALMRDVRDFEPRMALDGGLDGLTPYRELIPQAAARLDAVGALLLEVDATRAEPVAALAREALPGRVVRVLADLSGRDRVVEALAGAMA